MHLTESIGGAEPYIRLFSNVVRLLQAQTHVNIHNSSTSRKTSGQDKAKHALVVDTFGTSVPQVFASITSQLVLRNSITYW